VQEEPMSWATVESNTTTHGSYSEPNWNIGTLNVDETATLTLTATVNSGTAGNPPYINIARIDSLDQNDTNGTNDKDTATITVENPSIDIEKFTNGVDADAAPGPYVLTGSTVTWDYNVTNTGDVNLSGIVVTDNIVGTITCPDTTLIAGASMTCTATGTAMANQYENNGSVTGTSPAGHDVTDNDLSHYFGQDPSIDIEKSTNGADADAAPGPYVLTGSTVTWDYNVTNTGDVNLTNIVITDNIEGVITCPSTTLIAGETMTCTTTTGTATVGQYENNGSVTGTAPSGATVSDSDLSHYFGQDPSIDIEKSTNGADADAVPGPFVVIGSTVTWDYNVTNTGDVNLSSIVVTDNIVGAITCPDSTLIAGASMTCTATGTATAGQYENNGSVTGTTAAGATVSDSDLSHYFGENASIDLEKSTNGADADTTTGPVVTPGSPITWRYDINNTGNVDLTNIELEDDIEGTISCPQQTLAVGESMVCTATGTAIVGQYENTGTVTAMTRSEDTVTDSDLSHYLGAYMHIGDFAWYDDNNNGLQDAGEEPVKGLKVELLDVNGNTVATQLTDADGIYDFEVSPGTTYSVRFSGLTSEYVFSTKQNDSVVDSNGNTDQVTLASNQNRLDLDAGLFCITPKEGSSSGGDAMGNISAALMMLMTLMIGLFFVRREELLNRNKI
jgi:uncharacterized repeat protein (TIGR01451 family)